MKGQQGAHPLLCCLGGRDRLKDGEGETDTCASTHNAHRHTHTEAQKERGRHRATDRRKTSLEIPFLTSPLSFPQRSDISLSVGTLPVAGSQNFPTKVHASMVWEPCAVVWDGPGVPYVGCGWSWPSFHILSHYPPAPMTQDR